jgi:hypothetical protein
MAASYATTAAEEKHWWYNCQTKMLLGPELGSQGR